MIETVWDYLVSKNDQLSKENTKLKELLKSIEFIRVSHETQDGEYCPNCGRNKSFGHAEDCELSKALEK